MQETEEKLNKERRPITGAEGFFMGFCVGVVLMVLVSDMIL